VLGHHRVQLGVDVAPLAHAADADEVLAQQLLVLAVAELVRGGWAGGRCALAAGAARRAASMPAMAFCARADGRLGAPPRASLIHFHSFR
jgi:hypothetical protein